MATKIKQLNEGEPFFKERRTFGERSVNSFPVGPRTIKRRKENAKLNKLPDSIKQRCEIKLPGCLTNKFLSWAHSKKSRFITTDKDWREAARSCAVCHDALDNKMSHNEMRKRVVEAIMRRAS